MAKRIEVSILFLNKEKAKVFSEEPFDKVSISPLELESILPDDYMASTEEKDYDVIKKDGGPVKYIAYLYQGISGSYWRATEANLTEVT